MQQYGTSMFGHVPNRVVPLRQRSSENESSRPNTHNCPSDQAAIRHLAAHGGSLCTLVHIDGSYSRRIGAQLAIAPDGSTTGDLADHCLERELVHRASMIGANGTPELLVYGKGSPFIDFRLPCGSTIHLLLDPAPNQGHARQIVAKLNARQPATLQLYSNLASKHARRTYLPAMKILVFGEGPEAEAIQRLSRAYGAEVIIAPAAISADQLARLQCDAWTAVLCLSHDHEWERITLPWALASDAFYVGAIGGARSCEMRLSMLRELAVPPQDIARLTAPIGLFPAARHPAALALSAFAEIAAAYEKLVDG